MVVKEKAWIALLIFIVLLIFGASYLSYFQGDVAVARFVQWVTPESTGWWPEWSEGRAKLTD
jgi:TRAP-type mannitol/chloroaromatic compound transport system permease small subunit